MTDNFPELPEGYVKPTVVLVGTDGNAFALMAVVRRAITTKGREVGLPNLFEEQSKAFFEHATSGDYSKLLRACHHWAEVK